MNHRTSGLTALVLGLAIALSGCTGQTPTPTAPTTSLAATPVTPPTVKPADPLQVKDLAAFSGVAKLEAGSNCTGTLIDTGVPSGPAYLLTNGHCVGDIARSAQATTTNLDWFGTATFLAADGNQSEALTVDVTQLAYSTMRDTDTGIVRLKPSLAELKALGIRAVPIVAAEPAAGTKVVNVGVPVQDMMPAQWILRRGECTLGAQHTVIEPAWLWFGVWSNDCPGIIQGSSGSPLFTLGADGSPTAIAAMINTTTGGATAANGGACSINHPCEVNHGTASMVENTSYAQSVARLGRCFDASGAFDLGDSCPLPTATVWAELGGGAFRGGSLPNSSGRKPEVSLVGRQAGRVQTALVPLGDGTACRRAETYQGAPTKALPKAGEEWEQVGVTVAVVLPKVEGRHLLCAVNDGDLAGAASVLFDVDITPPRFPASADVEDIGDGAVVVRPHLVPPEISTVRFTWGDPATLSCDHDAEFQDFFIVPLTLMAADLPARYCIYGLDDAGNRTDVTTIEIPKR